MRDRDGLLGDVVGVANGDISMRAEESDGEKLETGRGRGFKIK